MIAAPDIGARVLPVLPPGGHRARAAGIRKTIAAE
jgi:hypothetical protein